MTNELEKKFFDTFGIEAKYKCTKDGNCYFQECSKCDWYIHTYPQINDRVLLELICIATASEITVEFKGIKNVEHLKEVVLNYCIERYRYCLHKDEFKHQVRTLFEEGLNDR